MQNSDSPSPAHLAIGIFDGVHLGHRAILRQAAEAAEADRGTAIALTFWPHPSAVLRPDNAVPMLYDQEQRRRHLLEAGVQEVVFQEFDAEFASMQAEAFPQHLKATFPGLKSVSVGAGFRYGKARRGDAALLVETGRAIGLDVRPVARVDLDGEPLSSTRIREKVASGDVAAAHRHLGRPYLAVGAIAKGESIGREIGFPTFNLDWHPELRPAHGVYAVRAVFPDSGQLAYDGVANYGSRPTVTAGGADPVLEVHLLEPPPDSPGLRMEVSLLHHIRPEKKFPSLDTLAKRIEMDVGLAKKLLAET